jgi:hypothetical protein
VNSVPVGHVCVHFIDMGVSIPIVMQVYVGGVDVSVFMYDVCVAVCV